MWFVMIWECDIVTMMVERYWIKKRQDMLLNKKNNIMVLPDPP